MAVLPVKLHVFITSFYSPLYLNVAAFSYILSGGFRVALPCLRSTCMSPVHVLIGKMQIPFR